MSEQEFPVHSYSAPDGPVPDQPQIGVQTTAHRLARVGAPAASLERWGGAVASIKTTTQQQPRCNKVV